eukprot:jgi/Ulvmu1/5175/UM021_0192.1
MPPWKQYDFRSHIGVAAVSFFVGIAVQHVCHHLRQLFVPQKHANAVQLVKETTQQVVHEAQYVSVSHAAIKKCCRDIDSATMATILAPVAFDSTLHFVDGTSHTLQYLLVLDALNFCFWPVDAMEYDCLSLGLKDYIEQNGHRAISAAALMNVSVENVRQMFRGASVVPLEEERARLLREVGQVLQSKFSGKVSNLIRKASHSAVHLVTLIAESFPGFRDHAVYNGRQVFFYKRAQIFVADVYGAFQGRGFGYFRDIDELTMFADYRIPVVLRKLGILQLSSSLASKIQQHTLLASGSEEECELRAASIQAVNVMVQVLKETQDPKLCPNAVQLDWWLWSTGESSRASDAPHHRTLSIFY